MVHRLLTYGLPAACALFLAAYWLDTGIGLFPAVESVENRVPAAFPPLDLRFLDAYPAKYEDYFDDHFRWRGRFQRFNATLQSITNGRSPLPDLVVVGTDDWYYKGGLQLDIYRGKRRFSPSELAQVVTELSRRRDSVVASGGIYRFAVAPLKHHIYPQHLPDYVRPLNLNHATLQLYGALDAAGVPYTDLHAALTTYADTADREDLYYRTDHHWTVKAGVVATGAILQSIALPELHRTGVPPPQYYYTERPNDGMLLAQMAGKARKDQELFYTLHRRDSWRTEAVPRPDITPPAGFSFPTEYAKQRQQIDPVARVQLPHLFVTRESFGENLYLPLSEAFGSSFWLFDEWKHGLNYARYRQEGGEVYLQLVWEGFLFNLLAEPAEDGKW